MSEILLNKFEKEKRVIELHNQGKTIRDIAKEVHMSFKDISSIIKSYERKKRLQTNSKNTNPSTKTRNLSISSQAFKLFLDNKRPTFVAIELDIAPEKAEKLWYQFLKLERREQGYEFFQEFEYNIPGFLTIGSFIKSNHVHTNEIAGILKHAKDIISLQLQISTLKREIEKLKQIKNNLQYSKDIRSLETISEINWNYPKYHI
jgi:transposase